MLKKSCPKPKLLNKSCKKQRFCSKGMVALIKQIRDVSDLISEREGVKAVARDSPRSYDGRLRGRPSEARVTLRVFIIVDRPTVPEFDHRLLSS
jgi:hypothetical protein